MSIIVTFIYEKRAFSIQCSLEEEIINIYKKFVSKLNPNLTVNDFDFFYEGKKLGKDSRSLSNSIFIDKNNITISAEKKSKIIKCPQCICNNCIIDIDNYIIKFYGCKFNHTDFKIFDDYTKTQKIPLTRIFCDKDGCNKNQENDPEDFYKCLTCGHLLKHSRSYCNSHHKEHDTKFNKQHIQVKFEEKNYFCEEHFKKFIKYCFKCKKNLCDNCEDEHKNHQVKKYDSMLPDINEFKESLNKIKEKIENVKLFIEFIKKNLLDGPMKIYEKYCEILNDIIEKYELNNKEFKNYGVLKNFLNFKKSNKTIMDDLDKIINEEDYKKKSHILIDMYQRDSQNYKNLNNNVSIETKKDDIDDLKEWEEIWKKVQETKIEKNLEKQKNNGKVDKK